MDDFECKRNFIEGIIRPIQRNVLIAEYCNSEFTYINLVDVFYRKIDSNAIFMFMIICIVFPILFMAISTIAEKYLSVGMQDLSKRFNLSPALAATTLIAFANGAPDIIAALSNSGDDKGAFIGIGALFGAFIFASTLALANVTFAVPTDIQLPKLAMIKEIIFYAIAVFIVIVFGFIRKAGIPFVVVYLSVYVVYIIATLKVDQIQNAESAKAGDELNSDIENIKKGELVNDLDLSKKSQKGLKVEEADEEVVDNSHKTRTDLFMAELIDEEAGFYQNAVLLPLMICGLFSISYLSNPLMKNDIKFVVLGITFAFILRIFGVCGEVDWSLAAMGVGTAVVFLVFERLKFKPHLLETIYEILSVMSAIAWIKIFSTFIIDFITFLAYYFSISQVVLASLLLSAGNSLGDLFGNAALAAQGEAVMGAMACYSGQIFNNYVGLTVNMIGSIKAGSTDFDLFGLDPEADKSKNILGLMPVGNLFVVIVIIYVLTILGLSSMYFMSNKFVLKKKFGSVLFTIYGSFFCVAIAFALLYRA